MSGSILECSLNDQIYENSNKTIRIFKTRKSGTIKYIAVKVYTKKFHKDKYSYEYNLINKINNDAVVNIMSSTEDSNYFYMEMEYCATGDLSRCLWQNKNNLYSERTIKTISTQLLSGLQALHKNGIIHCNLKPSNILIDEYGNVKICDFKKSLKVSTMNANLIKKNKNAMTPCYTAPELFQEEGMYSFKSDLWALGCIMYELAVGQVPFFDDSIGKLITKIINNEVNFNKKELSNYSDDFIDILKKLLIKEPNERSTWGDIERMPWWEGYFYNSGNAVNNKNDSSSNNSKAGGAKKEIDPLRLSKIAAQNKRDEKQDYNNSKEDEIDSADQEFDFLSKDLDDLDDNLNSNTNYTNKPVSVVNPMTQSKFPMNVSVLNISKVYKRDKRMYNDINAELIKSSEEELPKIEHFIMHQSDRVIKPIIGNKSIEDTGLVSYYKSKLPFTPWKKDVLKEMINSEKDLKNVEKYLYEIYTVLEQYANKNDCDNLINLLKYFETIVFDRELANNLINTSFIQQFIQFLKTVDNDQVKTRCCCIIGYLVRYATIIEVPLDNYDFCEIICDVIKKSSDNSDLIKKASATMGEYLFYVATQEETPENKEWTIKKKYLEVLLYCLDKPRNEIVKFYTIKTIENICILTKVSKTYFASNDDYLLRILNVYLNSNNPELKLSAISTVSQLLRHNPSLIKKYIDNFPLLSDKNLFLKEPDGIKQCLINCLLYSIVGDSKTLQYILPQIEELTKTLITILEKCNNVIKVKAIVLLGFFMIDQDIILKFGEEILIKMQKFRMDKNKEIHLSVKFFEKIVSSNFKTFSKSFNNCINKDKTSEIIKYCKIFDITGLYHRISRILFTADFLDTIKKYIKKKITNSEINDGLIGNLLDVLIKFSENPFSVEQNIDIIIKGFLLELLQLTPQIKGEDNLSKIRIICSNIFTIILIDERLYSPNSNEGIKTKEIQKLITNLMPSLKTLLQNKDIAEGILSLLSLIIERDEDFIGLYLSNGIIEYIFKIMKQNEYFHNLNIIKILITLTESKDIQFKEIYSMGLIDKVNYLIEKSFSNDNLNNNNYDDNNDEDDYLDYIFELFYDMVIKVNEYKKINYPRDTKVNLDSYKKDFIAKIEGIGKNFNLCIKLLGNQKNVNVQEMSCICLTCILQFFPSMKIKNVEFEFKSADIPNLLKGLELSCNKIHKKMINIFDWIIQFQDDGPKILKPYVSYITTYLENIINTSAEPDIISAAQNFINNKISKIK
jgi:serine/threonine-protein kinase ULK4